MCSCFPMYRSKTKHLLKFIARCMVTVISLRARHVIFLAVKCYLLVRLRTSEREVKRRRSCFLLFRHLFIHLLRHSIDLDTFPRLIFSHQCHRTTNHRTRCVPLTPSLLHSPPSSPLYRHLPCNSDPKVTLGVPQLTFLFAEAPGLDAPVMNLLREAFCETDWVFFAAERLPIQAS